MEDARAATGGGRRVPWTVNAILVLSVLPFLVSLLIAGFIWADWFGDDGEPLFAVLVVVAGCMPAVAAWALRRGNQPAWLAWVVFAAVIGVAYFPGWGVILPLVTLLLLFAPETRNHLRAQVEPPRR